MEIFDLNLGKPFSASEMEVAAILARFAWRPLTYRTTFVG